MFTDEILDKIFGNPKMWQIPLSHQSTVVHVVEEVLEEMGVKLDDAVSKSKS